MNSFKKFINFRDADIGFDWPKVTDQFQYLEISGQGNCHYSAKKDENFGNEMFWQNIGLY